MKERMKRMKEWKNEENIFKNEATQVDTEKLGQEKTMIQDISDLKNDNSGIELGGFNRVDRCVLGEWSRKIHHIKKHIRTENITDTNILIKAVIVYVAKKIGLEACGNKIKKGSEPWWKRRIKKAINEVKKHINILEHHQTEGKEERKISGT